MLAAQNTRIAICESLPLLRLGLVTAMARLPGCEVVVQVPSVAELLPSLARAKPRLVIMSHDDSNGLNELQQLRNADNKVDVILFSTAVDAQLILQSFMLGIQGFITKDTPVEALASTIEIVNKGGICLEPELARRVFSKAHGGKTKTKLSGVESHPVLSRREKQVLRLLAEGKSNSHIASCLFVCERTVKYHVSFILEKLKVRNRTEAALYVRQHNTTLQLLM